MSKGLGSASLIKLCLVVACVVWLTSGCSLHRSMLTSCGGCESGCSDCVGRGDCGCESGGLCAHYPKAAGKCVTGCAGGISGTVLPLLSSKLACGSGCGEIYWSEWACEPPDCSDPCDDFGCWVGPQTCCAPGFRVRNAAHCVGTSVSRAIGSVLGILGCGPCGFVTGSCGSTTNDDGCAGCSDCVAHEANLEIQEQPEVEILEQDSEEEVDVPTTSATNTVRRRHGRSPHRVFSRRIR